MNLRNMGHFHYLKDWKTAPPLLCSATIKDAETRLKKTEKELQKWSTKFAELCNEYAWLLFFSVPKLLRLYNVIVEYEDTDEYADKIVNEVNFLCLNNFESSTQLKLQVKVYK